MAHGVDEQDIFIDDSDRTRFLEDMRRIVSEASAEIIAYCLMRNHFHLAIKVALVPLSQIMQRTTGGYCRVFNRRHGRAGHLFQARFKAEICLSEQYLANLIPYIHLNPVRSGFVNAPQDWPWSSYKSGQAASVPADFNPWPTTREFELTRLERKPLALETIGASIASRTGIDLEGLRSGRKNAQVLAARRLFVREAVKSGHMITTAAEWLNVSPRSVSRYLREECPSG